jgi:colanic acid/amylovoran biosynthesis glycosyltransferase
MRIIIVTGVFPATSQAFLVRKITALAMRGHDVTVLSTARPPGAVTAPVTSHDRISVIYVHGIWRRLIPLVSGFVRFPRVAFKVCAQNLVRPRRWRKLPILIALATIKCDVVHFEWSLKAIELEDAFSLLNSPAVISCRGTDVRIVARVNTEAARSLRGVLNRAALVHCVSAEVQQHVIQLGVPEHKTFVSRPAVDLALFNNHGLGRSRPVGPLHLMTVGRLHWVKGHEYALSAVRALLDMGLDVRYSIIGPDDELGGQPVRFAIQDLGVTDRVALLGPQSPAAVRELLSTADIYLSASLSEGISNAVLEAMAMGIPVVVSNVGGMAEAVRNGLDGLVVASRDSRAIAEAVKWLADHPSERSVMGLNASQRINELFALGRQVDEILDAYEGLLGERNPDRTRVASVVTS